jgi:isocitrate lyase
MSNLNPQRFSFDFMQTPFILFASTNAKERFIMLEATLEKLAEKILGLDEASLTSLWEKYKTRMEDFDTTKEWEKAVIVFFIINSVRAKNHIFNENILKFQGKKEKPPAKPKKKGKPGLRLVK